MVVSEFLTVLSEAYEIRTEVRNKLSLKFNEWIGNAGNQKWKRVDLDTCLSAQKMRVGPSSHEGTREITIHDVEFEVLNERGQQVMEDISCDSTFMLSVMNEVGAAIRASYHWVPLSQKIFLGMDNAGGHGTDIAVQQYTDELKATYNIEIVQQVARSPETNLLDLGVWRSIQSAVEKEHTFKVYDPDALARSVERAWNTRLNQGVFRRVFLRLLKVLVLIVDDNGGNDRVEARRGKLFSDPVIDLTGVDTDNEEEAGDDGADGAGANDLEEDDEEDADDYFAV
jgi:hypothetical protein